MLNRNDEKKLSFIIKALYAAIIIALVVLFFNYVFSWVLPFLLAFGFSYIMEPFVFFMEEKWKLSRKIGSAIAMVVFLALLSFLFLGLFSTIYKEAKSIMQNIPMYLESLPKYVDNFSFKFSNTFDSVPHQVVSSLEKVLNNIKNFDFLSGSFGNSVVKYLTSFAISLPGALVFIIVTMVATYLTSSNFLTIKKFIVVQLPKDKQNIIFQAKHHLFSTLGKYAKAYFILLSVTFVELSIFFLIFRIQYAITLAAIIALVDILPVLGVGTVLIPWSLYAFIIGDKKLAIILIIIYVIVLIVRQFLEPKIIGDTIGLPPIATLFCIYVGLQLFGILGMFLVPISAIVIKNLQESGAFKIWKNVEEKEEKKT